MRFAVACHNDIIIVWLEYCFLYTVVIGKSCLSVNNVEAYNPAWESGSFSPDSFPLDSPPGKLPQTIPRQFSSGHYPWDNCPDASCALQPGGCLSCDLFFCLLFLSVN